MSTTRKIAHNTIAQMIGKVVSTALGLLALGMMTRYLGAEQFGWYITTISFLQFGGILIDFGLIPVTAQMLSEPTFEQSTLLQNLLGFRCTTAIVFFAIAPLIALFFPYPTPVKIAIGFTTISFIAISMNQIFTGYYQTKLRMHVAAISELIGRLILVAGIWFFTHTHATFFTIMGVLVTATVGQALGMWFVATKSESIRFRFDWVIWKAIMKKMWPIAISIIFNVVYLRGDVLLLSLYRSQTEVGLYGGAYRVLDIVSQLGMLMTGVMLPLMTAAWSRGLKEEFALRYQQTFDMLMAFGVPMMIGTLLLGEKIMVLVGGKAFAPAGIILQLLSLAVFGVYLGSVFGHTAVALNKQKQTMWIYLSDAVLTLTGYLICIPHFGATGAAAMSVFSELYAGFFLFLTVRRYSQTRLHIKTFSKVVFASLAMGLVLYLLPNLPVLLTVLLGIITYSIVLLGTKAISVETIRDITSLKTS